MTNDDMELTPRMRSMLTRAPVEWEKLPDNIGRFNGTLHALIYRREIEMQRAKVEGDDILYWVWRRRPVIEEGTLWTLGKVINNWVNV